MAPNLVHHVSENCSVKEIIFNMHSFVNAYLRQRLVTSLTVGDEQHETLAMNEPKSSDITTAWQLWTDE